MFLSRNHWIRTKLEEQLDDEASAASLKIGIEYQVEKTNSPAPGYATCGDQAQFTRLRESFCLIYCNDLETEEDPLQWPKPYENLPDHPKDGHWPIYLGTITWDTEPESSQKQITAAANKDADGTQRRYVGAVAGELTVPREKLVIQPSPYVQDSLNNNNFEVEVKGDLKVQEQLEVKGPIIGKASIQGNPIKGAAWTYTEKISFDKSITVGLDPLPEQQLKDGLICISEYDFDVEIPALESLMITLQIPFTGNDTELSRSRILLFF